MQFTVYRNLDPGSRAHVPYLLDVQSDLIEQMATRLVVPLISPARAGVAVAGLMPTLQVDGQAWVMDTPLMAGVSRRLLGTPAADLSSERSTIVAALDLLISGI